jgi:CRISPR-associated protein Csh2
MKARGKKRMEIKNSELLYIYDAKFTNPNGDPDEENRPRMDYETDRNLVSDVRLKRFLRDYFQILDKDIFVTKLDGKGVTSSDRVGDLTDIKEILEKWIDVRLFGATMTIKGVKDEKGKTKKGDSIIFTGPVQFNWGISLNKVDVIEASITSHFTSDEANKQGAIGKDYRVKYSFIAFSGIVSGKRAEKTLLKNDDILLMDKGLKEAIPLLATRSKIGQYPRLYFRVEYKDQFTYLGDLRDYIHLENNSNLSEIKDCVLVLDELIQLFELNKDKIEKIYFFHDSALKLKSKENLVSVKEVLEGFQVEEIG